MFEEKTPIADNQEPESEQETVILTADEFAQVKEHILKLEKEKEELVYLLQSKQAEFENYRKRTANSTSDGMDEGVRTVMSAVLPVLDDLERALEDTQERGKAWAEGVEMIARQLKFQLHRLGLEELPSDGKFDPALHDAVMEDNAENEEDDQKILEVFKKGYKVKTRILRHSMVKIAKYKK